MLPHTLPANVNRLNLARQYPVLQVENKTWIGTPNGFYQYNSDDDSFILLSLPLDLKQQVRQLYFYKEWFWCVLDSGLAALHFRLNEWLFFDKNNGLPENAINAMDFQEDYAWVATTRGVARFDLLIEEWEIYDQSRGLDNPSVQDLLVTGNKVWMLTPNLLLEYDPRFEKWRQYPLEGNPDARLNRLFLSGEDIWLLSNQGLTRFNPNLQTRQHFFHTYLQPENLLDLIIEENRIWAFSLSGIYFYEPNSSVWRQFEGNSYLTSLRLRNGYLDAGHVYILTDQNVLIWNRTEKTWEILDYASGLSVAAFESVYSDGSLTLLFNPGHIDYRKTIQSPWRSYQCETGDESSRLRKRHFFKNLFDNESGGFIPLGKYQWSLGGSRFTWLQDYKNIYYQQDNASTTAQLSGWRWDFKSRMDLGNDRTITGFYNDIDYPETMYGLRYKSKKDELIQELNWGDFQREPGQIPFSEPASLFGTNAWLQAGTKTPRFKKSRFTLKAQTGELRSKKTCEFHDGAGTEFNLTIKDIDYMKNQFYSIPGLDSLELPADLQIYVDDLNPSTNTVTTLNHQTIAGIVGDFDAWKATEDYFYYDRAHAIRFLRFIQPEWTIAVRFFSRGQVFEKILQHAVIGSTVKKNFYYLGAMGIVPYSFHLEIVDSTGTNISLDDFHLDDNGDGYIDSHWIDYENGILFFSQDEPFPAPVSQPSRPESRYQLKVGFQTELSQIKLNHNNLVRGSEILRLDGVLATGGNDYVVNYPIGTLIFVREGVVHTDTRIEIEYEYYQSDDNYLASAGVNWSPSDQFYLQGDWLRFPNDKAEMNDSDTTRDLLSLHGEIRTAVKGLDFRIVPGLAYHPDTDNLAGTNLEGFISSSRFRIQTNWENFSENYRNLYRPQSIVGVIKNRQQLFATADVVNYLRLTGELENVQGFAGNHPISPKDLTNAAGFLLHHQHLPNIQVRVHQSKTQSSEGTTEKFFYSGRWDYQLPESWSQKLFLDKLKIDGFLRLGHQTGPIVFGSNRQKFQQGYFRLNTQVSERFQGSVFYRRNDLQDSFENGTTNPVTRSERMLLDLSHEQWRLLQFNLHAENNLSQHFHRNSPFKNLNLRQFSQLNFRISPGQIWQVLTPLFFEINFNQTLNGWQVTHENVNSWLWRITTPNRSEFENVQKIRNYYVKNEYRPGARWLIFSLLELNNQDNHQGASKLANRYWRWTEKVDLKPGLKTHFILQYRQFYQDLGYGRITRSFEPSCWLEHRWSPDFQNIWNILYRLRQRQESRLQETIHNWEFRYDLIWRKDHFLGIHRRFEVRQSFAGTYRNSTGTILARNYQLTTGSAIDLYPLHSMIFRFRLDLSRYFDQWFPGNDVTSLFFNIKVSFRF